MFSDMSSKSDWTVHESEDDSSPDHRLDVWSEGGCLWFLYLLE